uniref:(northern house mosquito) hypothetical protein n=1 Tax=Culex pipiens TaxID=7175 RepID=A0A8D8A7W9_CULPI
MHNAHFKLKYTHLNNSFSARNNASQSPTGPSNTRICARPAISESVSWRKRWSNGKAPGRLPPSSLSDPKAKRSSREQLNSTTCWPQISYWISSKSQKTSPI